MAKQLINQRYVYKIHSTRFNMANWDLYLSVEEAKRNEELIPIADNQTLRFIRDIKNENVSEETINKIKHDIKKVKKQQYSKGKILKINELYNELDRITIMEDYLCIVFDNIKDWNIANSKNSVKFNGKSYLRLLGTNGGIKNNVIIFCSKEIHEELNIRLNNGRDESKKHVPAKFESYKALSSSASIPVTFPKKILVVKDGEKIIHDDIILLSDEGSDSFKIEEIDNYELKKQFTDGCGMISENLANQWLIDLGIYDLNENGEKIASYTCSGFNIRCSFLKGMLFNFDYKCFSEKVAKNYIVKDCWGQEHDIRDVDVVLTTNMLKLWDSYKNIDDYVANCKKNKYDFSVAKVLPNQLEKIRNMNYQFLQSYEFTDEEINELTSQTVNTITDVLGNDPIKTILFIKGSHMTENDFSYEDYDFLKALLIQNDLIKDPFIKQKVHKLIKKRIDDSKKGILTVDGNYNILSGDLYALCQYMFGLEPTGILKKYEIYSYEWNKRLEHSKKDIKEVVAFRAPMTIHNNIRKLKLVDNNEVNFWYRNMKSCVVVNSNDTTMDAESGGD